MPGEQYKGRYTLLSICVIGIFFSYLINGLVVEKVARGYGFRFYTSMIMVTTSFYAGTAWILLILKGILGPVEEKKQRESISWKTTILIIACSFAYVTSAMASNTALLYVNYPTQIVGKSGKPLAVLLMSIIIMRRKYTLKKCASIFLVVAGVSMFMLENARRTKSNSKEREEQYFGVSLVILSLLFDGLVAVIQQKIQEKAKFSAHDLMYNINKWAAIFMLFLVVYKGELPLFVLFCKGSPEFVIFLFALCITGVVGQHFIFLTIINFGPLLCSVITTTRKFFTILLSTLIFEHHLTPKHWISVIFVFSGLAMDNF